MEGLKPPGELSFEGNVSENWRRWRRSFENYLRAVDIVREPVEDGEAPPAGNAAIMRRQLAIFLHTAGEEAYEIYSQFDFENEDDRDDLDIVIDHFETYCNPRRNILYEWYVFWSMIQKEGEPIDSFVKRLKTQATKCEFGNLRDRMLLCRIVFGISSDKLKERMLRDNQMTLERAMNDIRAAEATLTQLNEIAGGSKAINVASMKEQSAFKPKDTPQDSKKSVAAVSNQPSHTVKKVKDCRFCGYDHARGKCPAYGQTCKKCGKKNHFARRCMSTDLRAVEAQSQEDSTQSCMHSLFLGNVGSSTGDDETSWNVELNLRHESRSKKVTFKVDTGAEANIVNLSVVKSLKAKISAPKARLTGYGNAKIENLGRVMLSLKHNSNEHLLQFEVVNDHLPALLGLKSCVALGIVSRIDNLAATSILDEFPSVFEGIGCFKDEHVIQTDPTVKPIVHAARRIPLSVMDKVKAELASMEQADIIAKVDKPTEWVNSMVVVEKKNGDIRICLDPRDLNRAIKREHHHIPTLEDIAHKFSGKKHFSIVDMKHGYWHVPLEANSSYLTTFNTPFGRYRFLRLPFGLHSSAEVFEKRVEQIFCDLDVCIYFDDLIVAGKDQAEHDENLRRVLARARDSNVKFNKDKIQLNKSEVSYLGHTVTKEGMRPDPKKVAAIQEMPEPTDVAGVQRLLGTLNFLRGYIPNMSSLTQPLRVLLNKESAWCWGPEQRAAISAIKKLLTSEPILRYFDADKSVELQVDASQHGLGAVLLQEKMPVAYASRSLTPAEVNYAQIDKELLAIVFGCEHFNHYIYGRPVIIQTDHNPLTAILNKPLYKASPRLQRLMLRLQRYDIAEVKYVPGKHLYLADTLSRAFLRDNDSECAELEGETVAMVHSLEITKDEQLTLSKAYQDDQTMHLLRQAISCGWNWSSRKKAPPDLQPYWAVKDELHEHDGFIYVGERLVVPLSQRKHVLKQLHRGHLGMTKCTQRAKACVFWPGLTNDIFQTVASCSTCARFSNQQTKEPLQQHEVPTLPWLRVAMDILEFKSRSYLVVVDCYSHFPELRLVSSKTASEVISALKSMFAVHGVPKTILADNMPFNSYLMQSFAKDWGFDMVTSSPHYPKSNGQAERYVQTMKKFLRKCEDSKEDIYASLLAYRETPFSGSCYSPAEMLFNRCIRSCLPRTSATLQVQPPSAPETSTVYQQKQKQYYDRSARALKPLTEGERVLVRTGHDQTWEPGTIVSKHDLPRSYWVDNGNSVVRRNRVHLKPNHTPREPLDLHDETTTENSPDSPNTAIDTASEPVTPTTPTPRAARTPTSFSPRTQRAPRSTRGILPGRYRDYDMA